MRKQVTWLLPAVVCLTFLVPAGRSAETLPPLSSRYWPAVSLPHIKVRLSSKVDETIHAIKAKEGQGVRAGNVLIAFDARLIEARIAIAEAEADFNSRIARAKADLAYLTRELQRSRGMEEFLSESELDKAKHAMEAARLDLENLKTQRALAVARLNYYKAQAEDYVIRAPIDGVVSRVWAKKGEMARQGEKLIEIISPDVLEVRLHLPEAYTYLVPGQRARVKFAAIKGREFEGTVHIISPYIDSPSGTFEVKLLVRPNATQVKPGMACQVKFLPPDKSARK